MKHLKIWTLLFTLMLIVPAHAWLSEGHSLATGLSVKATQHKLPDFFSQHSALIQHCSIDPDVFKMTAKTNALYKTEGPDHYFDLEWFEANDLPATRDQYFWKTLSFDHSFRTIGTLPYAITEWTTRLTLCLAEYRQWPDNPAIAQKCAVYAGLLAHYAQDACMPLHTTIHFDGHIPDTGSWSPQTGIHLKVDALLHKLQDSIPTTIDPNSPPYENILNSVFAQIMASNALVPQVYALEPDLPELEDPMPVSPELAFLTQTCLDNTVTFYARLLVTAWIDSEQIQLPQWHERESPTPIR